MHLLLRPLLAAALLPLILCTTAHGQEAGKKAPAAAASAAPAAAPEPSYVYWAKVVQVVDGSTVLLNIDLGFDVWTHKKSIRLLGVTAPSTQGADKAEGLKWKTRLAALLPVGAEITLKSTKDENDKSGNSYLGTLWVDGVNVNEKLLSEGR